MVWYDFISAPMFWLALLAVSVFAYGIIRATPLRRMPIFNNRRSLMIAAVIGWLVTSGVFGGIGFLGSTGSIGGTGLASAVTISDLQVTTSFASDAGGTATANSNVDDLIDVRLTDAQANETTGVYEVDDGIITVTRTGQLPATSCDVVASVTTYDSESTPGDGTSYRIVEVTTLGELEVYLDAQKSGSGSAAATTDPKERTTLEFDEGISKAHLGVLIEVDEDAHDNLNQYSYRDVTVDICGKPMIFRIHAMD